MPKLTSHIGVIVAVCSLASSPPSAHTFKEDAILRASDAQMFDLFGFLVAISGDTAIVGAPGEDGGDGDPLLSAGAAYVFGRDHGGGNNWGRVTKLTASDARAGDFFGFSVTISGDTTVAGALGADGAIANTGAAYVFSRDQGGANDWGEVAKLTASDAQESDQFGRSVAISGDTAVVGAPAEKGGPGDPLVDAGAGYVFRESFLRFFVGGLLSEPGVRRLPPTPPR